MTSSTAPSQPPTPPAPSTSSTPAPLTRYTKWRFAMGSVGTGGFATLPGLVLIYYITDTLGINPLLAGLVVACSKIWDVLADPLIGGISDRQLARTGSRRGLMLTGAVGLPICFALTFAVPTGLPTWAALTWVMLAFLGAATFFSFFQVPYVALPAELTHSYTERTSLLSLRVVVLTVTILAFGAGGPALRSAFESPTVGYLAMGVAAGVALGVGILIATSIAPRSLPTTPKPTTSPLSHYTDGLRVLRQVQPLRALLGTFLLQSLATGMMLGGAQYIATWILHDESAVTVLFVSLIAPALVFAPLWKMVADRVGKKPAFVAVSAMFTVAAVVAAGMIWAPGWWIVAPIAVAGAAYAGIQTLPMAMIPDVISVAGAGAGNSAESWAGTSEASASHTGENTSSRVDASVDSASSESAENQAGTISGVWTAGETIGLAMGSVLLAGILSISGYQESAAAVSVQPDSAILGIALSFSVIPALIMLGSFLTLRRYSITEEDVAHAHRRAHSNVQ